MTKYTLEDIMYGDKYGIESAVLAEVFRMAQQGEKAKEIKEQQNMIYVKHALLVAKKMHYEGDCLSDNEIKSSFNMQRTKHNLSLILTILFGNNMEKHK